MKLNNLYRGMYTNIYSKSKYLAFHGFRFISFENPKMLLLYVERISDIIALFIKDNLNVDVKLLVKNVVIIHLLAFPNAFVNLVWPLSNFICFCFRLPIFTPFIYSFFSPNEFAVSARYTYSVCFNNCENTHCLSFVLVGFV